MNYVYRIFLRFLRNQTGKQQKIRIVTWFWREKGKRKRRRRRHHPRRGSRWRGRRGRGERERRREGGEREGERRERDRWTEPPPLSPHSIPPPPLLAKTKKKKIHSLNFKTFFRFFFSEIGIGVIIIIWFSLLIVFERVWVCLIQVWLIRLYPLGWWNKQWDPPTADLPRGFGFYNPLSDSMCQNSRTLTMSTTNYIIN